MKKPILLNLKIKIIELLNYEHEIEKHTFFSARYDGG